MLQNLEPILHEGNGTVLRVMTLAPAAILFLCSGDCSVSLFKNYFSAGEPMLDRIAWPYETALGLPTYTANQKLYDLGVCNTFEEIRNAVVANQKERLL